MTPEQVLEAQTDLYVRLTDSEPFVAYITDAVEATARDLGASAAIKTPMVRALTAAVGSAYAYRVSADLTSLVEWAATQLEPEDKFRMDLMPTASGFVRFERSLPMRDVRGKTMLIDYLVWGTVNIPSSFGVSKPAMMTWAWNDQDLTPDEVTTEIFALPGAGRIRQTVGRWGYVGTHLLSPGLSAGPAWLTPSPVLAARLLASGATPTESTNLARYVMALLMLMDQPVVEESEVTGQISKKTQRATKNKIPGGISVIRLRKSHGGRRTGESQVEWTHRWVVRGHWRWQAYGPGRMQRRRQWISPHVKGPAGTPIVTSQKVYDVR